MLDGSETIDVLKVHWSPEDHLAYCKLFLVNELKVWDGILSKWVVVRAKDVFVEKKHECINSASGW